MQRQIVYFLIVAILVAVFALTNSQIMTVRLFFWTYELSGALVILFSVALGALLVVALNAVSYFKHKLLVRDLTNENQKLKLELEKATNKLEQTAQQVENLKAQVNQTSYDQEKTSATY